MRFVAVVILTFAVTSCTDTSPKPVGGVQVHILESHGRIVTRCEGTVRVYLNARESVRVPDHPLCAEDES
jgi:hypothetical protein